MFLQFLRGEVDNVMSGVGQQGQIATQVMDQLKSYVPKVQGAWVGGDEDQFAQDVATILVPAMMDLIAAIAGINTNLSSATNIIDQADQQATGMANQLGDLFGGIMGGGGGGGGGAFGGIGGMLGGMMGGGGGLGGML